MNKIKASLRWFVKWLAQPLMFFIGMGAVVWSMGCDNGHAEVGGVTVPSAATPNVTFESVGVNLVIMHDAKHYVTCWHMGQGVACLPDAYVANPGK